jgi:hypothetical protein
VILSAHFPQQSSSLCSATAEFFEGNLLKPLNLVRTKIKATASLFWSQSATVPQPKAQPDYFLFHGSKIGKQLSKINGKRRLHDKLFG